MDDRIHFIEHKGKQILLLDYSHTDATEMQLLLISVQAIVAKQKRESSWYSPTLMVPRSTTTSR